MDLQQPRAQEVLRRVREIPPGFVRSYGDLDPGAPRFAGAVMAACGDSGIPWHRVVRQDGSLAKGARQRRLLAAEGVPFRGARVDMRTVWLPVEESSPSGGGSARRLTRSRRTRKSRE
jgi:methylated-DNA-protein-cysteine methyltransferase-like protein